MLCSSQDIASIAKGDIIKGSGSLSFNQIYYNANGKMPSRNPYSYLLNGSINLKILGYIDAPFNFMYSNLGSSYTQPTFNQTSLHPRYKWVATHFGTIACSYSSYTVSGHLFQGAAVDLTPGNFTFSAFYGRFQKAISSTELTNSTMLQPAYKRLGAGCKIGYNHPKLGHWGLVLFSAKDMAKSIVPPSVGAPLQPQQNWNGSLQMQKNIFKKLSLSAELAYSMLSENTKVYEANTALPTLLQFRNVNASTALYKAIKTGFTYALKRGSLQMNYQRVDPFYRTLGAYYFNNDLENISAGFTLPFFKQKVNLSANLGVQHDNIKQTKLSTMNRTVGNLNLQVNASKKLNLNFNYSNFLSYTNVRPYTDYQNQINPYLAWDTLNFRQISQNLSAFLSLQLKADTLVKTSLTHSLNYQIAADQQNQKLINSNAFFNANLAFAYQRLKSGETLVLSVNAGRSTVNEMQLLNISPFVNFSKPLFNKTLKPTLSFGYTNSYYQGVASGGTFNMRGMLNYTFQKVHQFSLSVLMLNRSDRPATSLYTHQTRSNETTVSLVYSVNMDFFNIQKPKKEKGVVSVKAN